MRSKRETALSVTGKPHKTAVAFVKTKSITERSERSRYMSQHRLADSERMCVFAFSA